MLIREEQKRDWEGIYVLHSAVFETEAEANLVNQLRKQAAPIVSLVADELNAVAGHIMFSPVTLDSEPDLLLMGLGPMAVAPDFQKQGIGGALIKTGLNKCKRLGVGAVVVLGHPSYYPRFGFKSAAQYGIQSEFNVPADVFMAVELQPGFLKGVSGTICYHPAFNEL